MHACEGLASRLESQVSLAVTLWLSGVVVDLTFTPGGVDVRARLFVNHRHVCFYSRVKFSRLVLTAKLFFNSKIFPIFGRWPYKTKIAALWDYGYITPLV